MQLPQHPVVERRSINVPERAILRPACTTGRRPERARLDGGVRDVPEVLSGLDTSDVLATGISANIAEGSRVEVAKPTSGEAKR